MFLTLDEFLQRPDGDRPAFALFGHPIGHSLSPELHASLFSSYGLEADYFAVDVPPERLSEAVEAAKSKLRGFNCTIPHKLSVISLLDELTPAAQRLGAVNTVAVREGKLLGHNTDAEGFSGALSYHGCSPSGRSAAVLGAGGASRVMAYELAAAGATVTVASRDPEKSASLCRELSVLLPDASFSAASLTNLSGPFGLLVNGTPVGMWPKDGAAPTDLSRFPGLCFVFDSIYNPPRTPLLLQAAQLRIPHGDGLPMLLLQAAAAQTLWTGACFSDEVLTRLMDAAYASLARRRLHDAWGKRSVILSGFMGSGKTTVGRYLATLLCFRFVDLDAEIERRAGLPIPRIFAQRGEPYFRELETKTARELSDSPDTVLSTGGGTLIFPENFQLLSEHGLIVHLGTTPDYCWDHVKNDTGRPLLQTDDPYSTLERLHASRLSAYKAHCHLTVDAMAPVVQVCREILQRI